MKKMFIKWFIKNYSYIMEYRHYYKLNKPYFNRIKYRVFFEETIINFLIIVNKKFNLKINTDKMDIERYF